MRELTTDEIQAIGGSNGLPDFFPQYLIDDYLVGSAVIGLGIGVVTASLLNYYKPYGKIISLSDTVEGTLKTGLEAMQYGFCAWALHSVYTSYFS